MRGVIAHKCEAAVVRNIQPFVAISGPTISEFNASQQRALRPARARHQTERAVDVNPGSGGFGDGDDFVEWVEGSDVQITGIENHNRGTRVPSENRLELSNIDLAVRLGWNFDDMAVPKAEK